MAHNLAKNWSAASQPACALTKHCSAGSCATTKAAPASPMVGLEVVQGGACCRHASCSCLLSWLQTLCQSAIIRQCNAIARAPSPGSNNAIAPGPGHSGDISPTVSQSIDARHRCKGFRGSLAGLSTLGPPVCLDLHTIRDTAAHLLLPAQPLHRLLANVPQLQDVSSQVWPKCAKAKQSWNPFLLTSTQRDQSAGHAVQQPAEPTNSCDTTAAAGVL